MKSSDKSTAKKATLVFLFALLAIGLIGGTVAWLTATDEAVNSFSVGEFTIPTTKPSDSTQEITPGLQGNLYEEHWTNSEHKLLPGATFAKDPTVGLGPDSEDAVVYICVANSNSNKVHFTIDSQHWAPVSGYTTAGSASGTYTKGLFKYSSTLVAETGSGAGDVWTEPLFTQVAVAQDAEDTDFINPYDITVSSFIHQANDASGTAITPSTIENAAKAALTDCPANS